MSVCGYSSAGGVSPKRFDLRSPCARGYSWAIVSRAHTGTPSQVPVGAIRQRGPPVSSEELFGHFASSCRHPLPRSTASCLSLVDFFGGCDQIGGKLIKGKGE